MPKGKKLSLKQKRFADEYLKEANGTQSALKAYETTDHVTAGAIAYENLRKPQIQNYIARILKVKDLKPELILETLLQELNSPDAVIRLKAAELLGKHLKLFTDKVDHTVILEQVKRIGWADAE